MLRFSEQSFILFLVLHKRAVQHRDRFLHLRFPTASGARFPLESRVELIGDSIPVVYIVSCDVKLDLLGVFYEQADEVDGLVS